MKIRDTFMLLVDKISSHRVSKKKVAMCYVSLFLILMLLLTSTASWLFAKDDASFDTAALTMNSSAGMRVNNGEDISRVIQLSTNVVLNEASSVDGRNMFFPTSGSFTDNTGDMTFRDGNSGDKNGNYYYETFKLTSDSVVTAGSDVGIPVYIKSYNISVGSGSNLVTFNGNPGVTTECPIRIAFIEDSQDTPTVIDPSAALSDFAQTFNAVASSNDVGSATTAKSTSHSFSDFFYGSSPIFYIPTTGELDLAMVIWLEGTGPNCDAYIGKNISVDIELETNWQDMETVTFVDNTHNDDEGDDTTPGTATKWIDQDGAIVTMTYMDTRTNEYKIVAMKKAASGDEWTAPIPKYVVTDISFIRYNPESCVIWNAWHTNDTVDSDYDTGHNGADRRKKFSNTPLQSSREYTGAGGKIYRSIKYQAEYGNGWGDTNITAQRLVTGVGYWQTDGAVADDTDVLQWYITGTFNSWSQSGTDLANPNYRFVKVRDNEYTLTLNLDAGAYEFKFYATKDDTQYYYGNLDGQFTDTKSSNFYFRADDPYGTENMKIKASGGTYTFKINTSGVSTTDGTGSGSFSVTYQSTSGGGTLTPPTGSDYTFQISFEDNTSSRWVYNNVTANKNTLYIVFTKGGSDYYFPMEVNSSNYFQSSCTVGTGYTITGAVLLASGATTPTKVGNNSLSYSVGNNDNVNIKINSEDNLTIQ